MQGYYEMNARVYNHKKYYVKVTNRFAACANSVQVQDTKPGTSLSVFEIKIFTIKLMRT